MTGITLSRREDRLIAVKGSTPDGADRRFREAQLLARLDHPGIVQFVDLVDGETVEIHMAYAGADTWERQPPVDPDSIVDGLADVSATVADLHDLGTAHRALVAEHVVVAPDRRPVLCGLADACAADPVTKADDLAGLAGLIRRLSSAAPAAIEHELNDLADQAAGGALSARALAHELRALHPIPGKGGPLLSLPPRPVLLALGVVVAAGLTLLLWPRAGTTEAAQIPPTPTLAPVITLPTTSSPPLPPAAETTAIAPRAEANAHELVHGGRRFALGTTRDITLLGDWSCDGVATPALLQPATGLVAVYLDWPEAGGAAPPTHTAIYPNAIGLDRTSLADCDQLRVVRPTGSALFTESPS